MVYRLLDYYVLISGFLQQGRGYLAFGYDGLKYSPVAVI